LLAGCAPCQPFSTYSRKRSQEERGRGRGRATWSLVASFGRLVRKCSRISSRWRTCLNSCCTTSSVKFLDALTGYHVTWSVVDTFDRIGVPQEAETHGAHGIKAWLGAPFLLEADTPIETVRSKIAALPGLRAGQADAEDPLHVGLQAQSAKFTADPRIEAGWHLAGLAGESSPRILPSESPLGDIPKRLWTIWSGTSRPDDNHPVLRLREWPVRTSEQDRAIKLAVRLRSCRTFPPTTRSLTMARNVSFARLGRPDSNAVRCAWARSSPETFSSHVAHATLAIGALPAQQVKVREPRRRYGQTALAS